VLKWVVSLDSHYKGSTSTCERVLLVWVCWLLVVSCTMFFYIEYCTEYRSDACGSWCVIDDEC
jgi:hypothetical protein